ncbi:MAG: UvrD-helicase domain-containing protein [Salegentibacter sp.]
MNNSFTIYNASAGSGKTFTLVREYLVLLLRSGKKDGYRNILAITFTNKAVNEMKGRIIESLYAFSEAETPAAAAALLKAVCEETGMAEAEVKAKSRKILKSIIHNYAAFEVSTIDGFTHRVLRTFAKDLGLPVNFEVELNTRKILMEAVDSLISKAGMDKKLTKVLVDFALSKTDEDKSWDISRDLYHISELLTNETNQQPLALLKNKSLEDFENFTQQLKREIKKGKEDLKELADQFFILLEENGLEDSNFTRKALPTHFQKLREEKKVNFDAQWTTKLDSDPLYNKSFKDEGKKAIIDGLQPTFAKLFEASRAVYFRIEFLEEIKKRIVQLSLLNAINREVEEIKKERSLLLISEFNPRISAEVKDQPAPFIYERLGERYRNYFIDEFQDTSQMQWENLMPLIDHSLSGGGSEEELAKLMLVGDAKQSIYRWRGGKAEQFIDLCGENNPFSIDKKVENLPDNFRSGAQVVNFNNELFQFASRSLNHPEYSRLFKECGQTPRKGDFGYVNISFLEAENKEEEDELYPAKVLEIISDLEKRGFSKSDVCILTRKKSEGICIARHLSENGISVVSSETLLIENSSEVNFIVSLLEFSLSPENNELKLAIFNYLQEKLDLENPHEVISRNLQFHGTDFFNWLSSFEIDFNLEILKTVSLYEAAEYIIRSFELVKDSDAYIQFFLDYIFETTQRNTTGIQEFIELWKEDKSNLSIVVPKEENAVQIMTIHKSKGLEFPIVIYPYANSDFRDTKKDSVWLELDEFSNSIPVSYLSASQKMANWGEAHFRVYEELLQQKELDSLNVFYVACTRASRQLYILSKAEFDKKTGNEKSGKTSGLLIGFLKEKGLWNGDLQYEFGHIEEPLPGTSSEAEHQQVFYSSSTQNQAVNIVTRSGSLWDTRQEEAIEKGLIAHDILAKINSREDLDAAIESAVHEGIISAEVRENMKSLIEDIIAHPDLKEFFEPGVSNFNERDILLEEGRKLRPDRLNFSNKKVSIIDYKTGTHNEAHSRQINEYGEVLESMGFSIEKKILVYINSGVSLSYV